MNVLFLSPHFPPHVHLFCAALRRQGARVLGMGDTPPERVPSEVHAALDHYAHVPGMEDYEPLMRAAAWLISEHGRIEAVDSHNEHWLEREAHLREDFNIPGPRVAEMAAWRSKAHMAEVFERAGIDHPRGVRACQIEEGLALGREEGFPLIVKPVVGVAAQGVRLVDDEDSLRAVLADMLGSCSDESGTPCAMVQQYVAGPMVSYDGLVDADGRIVFAAAHENSSGVMEIAQHRLDMHYCSLREIPPDLERMGQQAVAAFGLRGRFFHFETLRQHDGRYVALEMNVRPPGGFTTDMMNFACDVDVYDLWAKVIVGRDLSQFRYERPYHCAHVSRRNGRCYRLSHDELVRELGSMLVASREMPPVLSLMGDHVYLIRHPEMDRMREAYRLVQELSGGSGPPEAGAGGRARRARA